MCTKYKNGIRNASISYILGQVTHQKDGETRMHGSGLVKEVFSGKTGKSVGS